jgi:carboxyl-terminal processing protease
MMRIFALVALSAALASAAFVPRPLGASTDVSILDLIEIEFGYSTIAEQYYEPLATQRLLDGARTGLLAYLRGRGIADPQVAVMHARADGRGAVPAIEQQVGRIIERYGARVDARELVYSTIRGEVAALHDPYSVFFTRAQLASFSRAIDGSAFGGVGIVLAQDPATKSWRIDTVFDGGPAARAGLAAGDQIGAVGGTPVAGLDSAAVTNLLRGKPGTVVQLSVTRAGAALGPVAVTRANVTPPEVTSRLLPGGVGYVALRGFDLQAADEVRGAVERLRAQGARALVFDLRGNGGGYESAAVHVASLFVPSGPIVAIQERRGHRRVTPADGKALAAMPLAVLVDGDSASGAELVAAAIHDHGRGTLVGARTFGKGVVQTMEPLPDGSAIKLTTARYFTPDGSNIDRIGITPDDTVAEPPGSAIGAPGHDPQLDRALAVLGPTGA